MRPKNPSLITLVLFSGWFLRNLVQCSQPETGDSTQDSGSGPRVRRQRLNESETATSSSSSSSSHAPGDTGNPVVETQNNIHDLFDVTLPTNQDEIDIFSDFQTDTSGVSVSNSRYTHLNDPLSVLNVQGASNSQQFVSLPYSPVAHGTGHQSQNSQSSYESLFIPFTQPDSPSWSSGGTISHPPPPVLSHMPTQSYSSSSSLSSRFADRQRSFSGSDTFQSFLVNRLISSPATSSTLLENQLPNIFDVSDADLMPFMNQIAVERVPSFGVRYGEFYDPLSGTRRFVTLPARLILNEEFSDEQEDDEEDQEESNLAAADSDETRLDSQETDPLTAQRLLVCSTPPFSLQSPAKWTEELICPPAPDLRQCRASSHKSIGSSRDNYGRNSISRKRRKLNTCDNAAARFKRLMALETAAAQIHLDFPIQAGLLESIEELENSHLLSPEHLRAFEVRFDLFLLLVQKCPSKYFGPALALSLQYDQDFPKFLQIFYGVKDLWRFPRFSESSLHQVIVSLALKMPRISNAAFEFLTSSKNALFFFPHKQGHPHYKGKFSHHLLAINIASYLDENADARNPQHANRLRSWILDFDYLEEINLYHLDKQFSEVNLRMLPRFYSLFRNGQDYSIALYKLVKTVYRGDIICFDSLHRAKHMRLLLSEALRREDFEMVTILFKTFDLECHTASPVAYRSQFTHIQVKRVNDGFCSVKIYSEGIKLTLILPLIP